MVGFILPACFFLHISCSVLLTEKFDHFIDHFDRPSDQVDRHFEHVLK